MVNSFKYSILRYRPSYLLDEQVNIGLLFSFPKENSLIFIYPSQLQRLKSVYPDTNLNFIKKYLSGFKSKANKLSGSTFINDLSTEILANEFLTFDDNSFYFAQIREGHYSSKEDILNYYERKFFSAYNLKNSDSQLDDSFLVKFFSEKISNLKSDNPKVKLIKKKVKIRNPISITTFDYAWKNGSINLVKALSFDLKQKESIQKKSFRWYGELSNLNEVAEKEGYKFDLLVAPPNSSKLGEPYEKAIDVLRSIKDSNNIIEMPKIDDYLNQALKTIKPLKELGN